MSRVIKCDRCGGEVDPVKIGYISILQRKDGDELTGENPFEKMDFCSSCMEMIADFITNAPTKRVADFITNAPTKRAPKSPRGGLSAKEPP